MSATKYNGLLNDSQIEFSTWLKDQHFDTFATFTTKQELTLQGSRRMAERFHNNFDMLKMFWAAEPFDIRNGFHFHALLNTKNEFGMTNYQRKQLWDYWTNEREYGISDFTKITKEFGADWTTEYITKYIAKSLTDYDFYDQDNRPEKRTFIKPAAIAEMQHHLDEAPKYVSKERLRILNKLSTKTQKL